MVEGLVYGYGQQLRQENCDTPQMPPSSVYIHPVPIVLVTWSIHVNCVSANSVVTYRRNVTVNVCESRQLFITTVTQLELRSLYLNFPESKCSMKRIDGKAACHVFRSEQKNA
jgi:hypothetical protein